MMAGPLGEMALGDPKAPNTVIEYASMTCPHCQRFHRDVYPAFKTKYIDTGKVYFIFREYPLDPLATSAIMLARCGPKDRYFPLVDLLFDHQSDWAFVQDPVTALQNLVKQAGFTEDDVQRLLDESVDSRRSELGEESRRARSSASTRRRRSSSTARSTPANCRWTRSTRYSAARPALPSGGTRSAAATGSWRLKFTRLRVLGFKSFVEPTEFLIEPGLTGVVGPERLRQVQSGRGAALGDGRKLVQEHARVRHGRRHLPGQRQPPGAQHGRSLAGGR